MIDQSKPGQLVIRGKKFIAKVYEIDGEQIEVYRIGALAHALGKNSRTVEGWEREGLFPKPIFQMVVRKGDGNCKRWYTRGQILNIYKVWKLFPLTKGRQPPSVKKNFFETVKKVFFKLNEISITVEPKNVEQQRRRAQSHPSSSVRGSDPTQRPGQGSSGHPAAAGGHFGTPSQSLGGSHKHTQPVSGQRIQSTGTPASGTSTHPVAKGTDRK